LKADSLARDVNSFLAKRRLTFRKALLSKLQLIHQVITNRAYLNPLTSPQRFLSSLESKENSKKTVGSSRNTRTTQEAKKRKVDGSDDSGYEWHSSFDLDGVPDIEETKLLPEDEDVVPEVNTKKNAKRTEQPIPKSNVQPRTMADLIDKVWWH